MHNEIFFTLTTYMKFSKKPFKFVVAMFRLLPEQPRSQTGISHSRGNKRCRAKSLGIDLDEEISFKCSVSVARHTKRFLEEI